MTTNPDEKCHHVRDRDGVTCDACVAELRARVAALTAQKDGAYSERDQVVAAFARLALASGLKAWTARHVGDPWDEDWRGIVFIELPTGQASWHYHDSEHHLFADLPTIGEPWDGHDTPEKYQRLKAATYRALDFKAAACTGTLVHSEFIGCPVHDR